MSETVSWNFHLSVQDGRLDDARALMSEMVEATKREPGTVGYEWFLSGDGTACHIMEKFADSGAAAEHIANFGANFAARFLACFAPTALYVYGQPSEEVRAVLDGQGAVNFETLGGFTR